jgi:hypothetical protein
MVYGTSHLKPKGSRHSAVVVRCQRQGCHVPGRAVASTGPRPAPSWPLVTVEHRVERRGRMDERYRLRVSARRQPRWDALVTAAEMQHSN